VVLKRDVRRGTLCLLLLSVWSVGRNLRLAPKKSHSNLEHNSGNRLPKGEKGLRNWICALRAATTELVLFFGVLAGTIWIQKPSRFFFFGDSWDVLYLFLIDPRTIWQPHNEHFVPIFKLFYFLQYKLFGANHLGYMLVLYVLHSLAAVLVYRIGRQIQLSYWSSIAATLIFSFSSVAWEVMGWSFEQSFALAVVFLLASLDTFLRGAPSKRALVRAALLSLVGYWAGGPIGLVLPAALTAYWLVWFGKAPDVIKGSVVRVLTALWLPVLLYYATVRLAVRYTSQLPLHPIAYPKIHLHLRDLPAMLDFSFFGTAWGVVLPTLTFIHSQTLKSASVILILLAIVAVISYRGLSHEERLSFWLLIWITVGAYLVISLGRLQFGIEASASSRYQYLSAAPFALLLALCWVGLQREMTGKPTPLWWRLLSFFLLAYLLAFHAKTIRVENIDADRGEKVQEFLAAVKKASFPAHTPRGAAVLGASFQVPPYVIPPRRPLWMILQVIEGNTKSVVPVEKYLSNEDELMQFNIIQNGGFEDSLGISDWRSFAGAEFSRDVAAKHHGEYGVSISLPGPGSAFSKDVVHDCSPNVAGKVFTFAVQAKTHIPAALIARMLFKAGDGKILATYASEPHSGDAQWRQLVTGGLSPPGTCTVGVDLSNDAQVGLTAMIDDALLLLHPAILNQEGAPIFQSPVAFTTIH
jgi:hypothetical protein